MTLTALLLTLLLLSACGLGGGFSFFPDPHPANTPPVIEGGSSVIYGAKYATAAGQTITLQATTRGSLPMTWSWDFGGGASPNTSSAEVAQVMLPTPGAFHCRVSTTNAFGSNSQDFDLEVLLPPVPVVNAVALDPPGPRSGADVTFSCDCNFDNQLTFSGLTANWSWDLGVGGAPVTKTAPSFKASAPTPGTYHGSVAMSNAAGSATQAFDYMVAP